MSANSLKEIVELPLTGLRYGLSDKLLRVNASSRSNPIEKAEVERIHTVLEEAGVRTGQLDHFLRLHEQLRGEVKQQANPGGTIWEMIILLRLIQAENDLSDLISTSIDRVMMDWQGHIFPKPELDIFLKSLQIIADDQNLDGEILNASTAVLEGLAPEDPDMESPEKQLLWAAHILYLIYNPELTLEWPEHRRGKGPLHTTQLWRQLLRCKAVRYLRALFASHIFNLLRNNNLMVGWGAPGSWFSYSVNPPPGRINCDLLYSMLAGFDHARACVVHEIGHAVQTRGVPSYMQELSDAIQDIESSDDAYNMTQELRLKQYFLNACEDNCVNRFTEQVGQIFGQDYGYSLHNFYTAIGDVGRRYIRQREVYGEPSPENRFKNLTFIISRVFLANNGLFPNTPEGWASLKARPEWIAGRDRDEPTEKLDAEASFQQLLEMCEEVEQYFPPLEELAGGPAYYGEQAEAYAERRFELIHEMWDLYAKDIVAELLEDEESDADDAMDQFEMETNKTPPPPKKKQKDPEEEEEKDENEEDEKKEQNPNPPTQADQSSENESDEDLEGEEATEEKPDDDSGGEEDDADTGEGGEGEEDLPDEGEDSEDAGDEGSAPPENDGSGQQQDPAQKPDKEEKDSPEKEEQEGEDSKQEEQDSKQNEDEMPAPEDGEVEEQEQMQESEGKEEEGGGEAEEEPGPSLEELMEQLQEQMEALEMNKQLDESDEAEQKVEEDDENPEAELIREVVDESQPPEQKEPPMQEEEKQGEQGANHGGGDSNSVLDSDYIPEEELSSVSELMDALKEADEAEEEQKREREKRQERREERQDEPPPRLESPKTMSLDELASGSWEDFSKRVTMHGAVIGVMASALEKLKTAQLKFIHKVSKKHTLIPQGGDLRRFDQAAMYSLLERIAKNESFDKDDLSMFRKDGRVAAATRPTRVILIDGSRSMTFGGHPMPMDKALQEAVIDYMASRIAGYDTYIVMFGPANPPVIATPGGSLVEIGKTIEKVHGGLNTMTYLSPALLHAIQLIAYRKKFTEPYVGFTNFVIYSDGDIDDLPHSRAIIQQIIQHAPKSTFDFVLITSKQATPMDVLINTLEVTNPIHEIGIVRGNATRKYPMALTATYKLTNRLRAASSGFADPAFLRAGQFKRLFQLLTQPPEDGQ